MLQNLRHSTWNTHFKLHNSSTAVIYSPVCAISKPSLCHKKFGPLPFYWRLYSLCLNLSSTPSGSKILSVSYSFFSDHQVMVDHESLPHRPITDITSSGLKLSLSLCDLWLLKGWIHVSFTLNLSVQVFTSTAWNSGSGYVSVEDMIEFPFLDIPDLSNVQQDGFGLPSWDWFPASHRM